MATTTRFVVSTYVLPNQKFCAIFGDPWDVECFIQSPRRSGNQVRSSQGPTLPWNAEYWFERPAEKEKKDTTQEAGKKKSRTHKIRGRNFSLCSLHYEVGINH